MHRPLIVFVRDAGTRAMADEPLKIVLVVLWFLFVFS
jgi:hypothetical protein